VIGRERGAADQSNPGWGERPRPRFPIQSLGPDQTPELEASEDVSPCSTVSLALG